MSSRWPFSLGVLALAASLAAGGCTQQPTPSGASEEKPADSSTGATAGSAATSPKPKAENGPGVSPLMPPPEVAPLFVESKIVTSKFEDGKPKRQHQVSVYTGADERYDGEFKEWHPNGKLWKQGQYKNGLAVGEWKYWHDNGTLAKSGNYKTGQLDGVWIYQHPDGTKSREESWSEGQRHGVSKSYDATGSRLTQQQQFKKGVPDGTWTNWFANGQKATEEIYVDGQPHGTQLAWFENGKQRASVEFRNGKRHGKAIRWDPNGKQAEERLFRDGDLVVQ